MVDRTQASGNWVLKEKEKEREKDTEAERSEEEIDVARCPAWQECDKNQTDFALCFSCRFRFALIDVGETTLWRPLVLLIILAPSARKKKIDEPLVDRRAENTLYARSFISLPTGAVISPLASDSWSLNEIK